MVIKWCYLSLGNKMLDFLCLKILPKIHNHVKSLNLEVSSMERILLSTHYPDLCKIALYNIDINTATRARAKSQKFGEV
jgi:hypothetical protein